MSSFVIGSEGRLELTVMDYGGVVQSLRVPDRRGVLEDVVLGFDDPDDYRESRIRFGPLVGRYANRIRRATFEVDGIQYQVTPNVPPHHLHGGRVGFDSVTWAVEPVPDPRGEALELRHTSPDGDEGYPGRLEVRVRYTVTVAGAWIVEYEATTDRPTPVNFTQHTYFNLSGGPADRGSADIRAHELLVNADAFTPMDGDLIPTGEVRPVDGTPFDFRHPHPVGARIDAEDEQIRLGGGYDHNYVLRAPEEENGLRFAARLSDPGSGRTLEVRTTEPGMQLYAGAGLAGVEGKGGTYARYAGLALETQHFPDSPNRPGFPSTILRPGEVFRSTTIFRFGVADRDRVRSGR